ncbi:hypothetical protein FPZ24_08080 [Sphingomonas panacisoli]|uniref:Holin n=1 Tax=Sphingomonas panacisoli TaxID=1813879 RepID=A0A5B8LHD2_9SPHN|nr:hypothetical protein [Sphingomonas panacisoli]QDZ07441.1 hypothetical protein FPZ24_08080 [Sphingomonas panacisoli]
MTDLNPDVPDKPIEVPVTPTAAQVGTGTRDVLLLVAALPALVAVLGKHSMVDTVNWLGSEPGLAFVGLVIAIGTPAWRQWKARRQHANELKMAKSASDNVAVVKS